ncbi:uncharacterized protein LOC131932688 [Physella acuta]|uniref:uncharacterized protein LOC131932688 n=1 Tax=Physella acuta TaxID=109671 RepID=UPI0027DE6111|nr:uncharacterized protein LOC131932688 [Physella acuta]
MFHVDSSSGRLEFHVSMSDPRSEVKHPLKHRPLCHLFSGRLIFFHGVLFFAVIVVLVIRYADICPVRFPAHLEVTLAPIKVNETLLDGHFQVAMAAINLSLLAPLPTVPTDKKHLFQYELSEFDLEMISEMLSAFDTLMKNASITYFLYKGSLLGSYRHHSIIPWDDDLDFLVSVKEKEKIKNVFHNHSIYLLDTLSIRYKVYHKNGHPIKDISWKSPFLDISFYTENSTHIWDVTLPSQSPYPKSSIFPLTERPLLGALYPSPRDPLKTLQANYNLDDCHTGTYNHTGEFKRHDNDVSNVRCSALIGTVPFVQHVRGPGGAWCEELLTFRGKILNTFVRDAKDIPVC